MNPPLSHPHVLPAGKKRPAIALIIPNTLTALGLAGLLTRMVPHAEIALFHDFREAEAETEIQTVPAKSGKRRRTRGTEAFRKVMELVKRRRTEIQTVPVKSGKRRRIWRMERLPMGKPCRTWKI